MRLRSMLGLVGLAVIAAGLPACALRYNGTFGVKERDKKALAEYRQFLQQRDLALDQAERARLAQVDPGGLMTNRSGAVPSANLPLPPDVPQHEPAAAPAAPQPAPAAPVPPPPAANRATLARDAGNTATPIPGRTSAHNPPPPRPRDGTGNLRHITFATDGADFDPVVSPDGKWLVFASTRHRTNADLYMKRVDAAAVTQLTSDPGKDVMPAISPDGKLIAFTSERAGNWDIYLMDIAGGQAIQMTHDPAAEIHPSFSPDGRWLVYCQFSEPSSRWELVLLELANPAVKRFIGYGLFPNWSPTDDRIVFQRASERGAQFYSIWTIELVDGEALRPTEVAVGANAAAITPDWSPDGKHIVFCTVTDRGAHLGGRRAKQSDIWVVDVNGRNRVNLTRSLATNLQPVWGRDGTIYFTSNRSLADGENVWSLRPDRALQIARQARAGDTAAADSGTPLADQSTAQAKQ